MDDVPGVPGGAGFGLLFGRGGAEAQTLDLLRSGLLGAQGDDDREGDAEQEHPDAERVDVHLVEDEGEDVVGLRVDDHRDEAGEAQDETHDEGPHTGLRGGLLPADTQEEHGGDGRGEEALDALDVVVQALRPRRRWRYGRW